jgi:hypothetical protein
MTLSAFAQGAPPPPEWQTKAEATDYRDTWRYPETIAYAKRLAGASSLIRYATYGKSGEGRDLPLLIATQGRTFTPAAARRAGKVVVFVQAGIHAGEIDGKDAGFALLRDIAITKTRNGLLDRVVLLFTPIYNVDGHERFTPYNRINQNGPAEMGWRATTTNLNLNRDYMKADAPETRAFLKLWNEWNPDLFIDCHVTDGADHQYNITYQYEFRDNVHPAIRDWLKHAFNESVFPAVERDGNLVSQYMEFLDNRDMSKGVQSFLSTPRYATGYAPIRNRPALLIETHVLKDYRSRVRGTYDVLRRTLEEINKNPQPLLDAVHKADADTIAAGRSYDASRRYPLLFELTQTSRPYAFKGVESHLEKSDVSGDSYVVFGQKPQDQSIPLYDDARIARAVAPPLAYIVPPQWQSVIDVLAAHGLKLERTKTPLTLDVESYRFSDVRFAGQPFEGRVQPSYTSTPVRSKREFPAGSVIVTMEQPAANVAVHLLEPASPDSLASWGFFNAIFEQKETAENYILERVAKDLLAKDANLRREFEQKLSTDAAFAASPRARLDWVYQRSPYWDEQMNLYPVGRILLK